ncbi:hypothetical protein CRUP_030539 [Coryphaenoides rupestris]|nr:hypothetical protein CRUP_030539 [Coryphaenoides rupestris]
MQLGRSRDPLQRIQPPRSPSPNALREQAETFLVRLQRDAKSTAGYRSGMTATGALGDGAVGAGAGEVSPCQGGSAQDNGTCVTHLNRVFLPPFSSTAALVVLVAMIAGIVLVSMATFHLHKRKLRKRKIQRAHEEYERDRRRPHAARGARAGGGGGDRRHPRGAPPRVTTIVRPSVSRDPSLKPPPGAAHEKIDLSDAHPPPAPPPPPAPACDVVVS